MTLEEIADDWEREPGDVGASIMDGAERAKIHLMSGLLIINLTSSECAECGQSCDPRSRTHDIVLGYYMNGAPGCGVEWDRVTSYYFGSEERIREMRPDLTWVEP